MLRCPLFFSNITARLPERKNLPSRGANPLRKIADFPPSPPQGSLVPPSFFFVSATEGKIPFFSIGQYLNWAELLPPFPSPRTSFPKSSQRCPPFSPRRFLRTPPEEYRLNRRQTPVFFFLGCVLPARILVFFVVIVFLHKHVRPPRFSLPVPLSPLPLFFFSAERDQPVLPSHCGRPFPLVVEKVVVATRRGILLFLRRKAFGERKNLAFFFLLSIVSKERPGNYRFFHLTIFFFLLLSLNSRRFPPSFV